MAYADAPARAINLDDRGTIAPDKRADLILVDDSVAERPRVVAVPLGGRIVHITVPQRLS